MLEAGHPPSDWRLSVAGADESRRLGTAAAWRGLRHVVTSPEPKARATAEPISLAAGVEPLVAPDLREVERGESSIDGPEAYISAVVDYFDTGHRPGWEPLAHAADRVTRCLGALLRGTEGDVCAVSHGLLLSLYLASREGRRPDPAAWSVIPLPGVAVVQDGSAGTRFLTVEEFLAD